jgi:hypothetical protein
MSGRAVVGASPITIIKGAAGKDTCLLQDFDMHHSLEVKFHY